MKECKLCDRMIDMEIIKWEEEISGEPFKEGYCSEKCEQTDRIITDLNI